MDKSNGYVYVLFLGSLRIANVEEVLTVFEQDDFLKIKGLVNKYKNRFQLTIHKLRKLGDSEIEFADYLPKTTKDIDELWRTLGEFVTCGKKSP